MVRAGLCTAVVMALGAPGWAFFRLRKASRRGIVRLGGWGKSAAGPLLRSCSGWDSAELGFLNFWTGCPVGFESRGLAEYLRVVMICSYRGVGGLVAVPLVRLELCSA